MRRRNTKNDEELRAAMNRLLAGAAVRTDGELTASNVVREAGFGDRRGVLYRSVVHDEFARLLVARQTQDASKRPSPSSRIEALRAQLLEERARNKKLRFERDQAVERQKQLANVIAVQDAQIQRLTRSGETPTNVRDLPVRRPGTM